MEKKNKLKSFKQFEAVAAEPRTKPSTSPSEVPTIAPTRPHTAPGVKPKHPNHPLRTPHKAPAVVPEPKAISAEELAKKFIDEMHNQNESVKNFFKK
jgi:hypothetical protein